MHKSILVLEESHIVHELFESALPDGKWKWEIHHESSPDNYLQKAQSIKPDVIFLSNQDQKRGYPVVKGLNKIEELNHIPLILLTVARDQLNDAFLEAKGVTGFIRKPFESTVLLEQLEAVLIKGTANSMSNPALENIDVIDDELKDLLSDNSEEIEDEISLNSLEDELDPTDQLEPVDNLLIEPIEDDEFDFSDNDELEEDEQELLSESEFDNTTEIEDIVITEDTDENNLEFSASDDSVDYDLEEEDLDVIEQNPKSSSNSQEPHETNSRNIYQIPVSIDPSIDFPKPLFNEAEDGDPSSITELKVHLFDHNPSTADLDLETDTMEQYEMADSGEDDQNEFLDVDDYDDVESSFDSDENILGEVYDDDLNEIESFEADMDIPESLEGDESDQIEIEGEDLEVSDFENEEDLLELQIDDFEEELDDDEALYDNEEVVQESDESSDFIFTSDEDEESDILEPEDVANLEIDLEDTDTLLPEIDGDLSEEVQFDDEESLEKDADPEQSLQQMINFRHVSKAHYDLGEDHPDDTGDQGDMEFSVEVVENADEVSIEVNSDVFEMDDFNIENVIADDNIAEEDIEEDLEQTAEPAGTDDSDEIDRELEESEVATNLEEDVSEIEANSEIEELLDFEEEDDPYLSDDVNLSDDFDEETEITDPEVLMEDDPDGSVGVALKDEELEEDESVFDQSIDDEPEPEDHFSDEFSDAQDGSEDLFDIDIDSSEKIDENQEIQQYEEIELSADDDYEDGLSLEDDETPFGDDSEADEDMMENESEVFEGSDDLLDDPDNLFKDDDEIIDEGGNDFFDDDEISEEVDGVIDLQDEDELADQELPEMEMDAYDSLEQELDDDLEGDLFKDNIDLDDSNKPDMDLSKDTEVLNSEEEFLDYPGEDAVIGADDEDSLEVAEYQKTTASDVLEPTSEKPTHTTESDLNEMIEGIITKTIKKTLHDTLPDLVEKIIKEEMENS